MKELLTVQGVADLLKTQPSTGPPNDPQWIPSGHQNREGMAY